MRGMRQKVVAPLTDHFFGFGLGIHHGRFGPDGGRGVTGRDGFGCVGFDHQLKRCGPSG